MENPQPTILVVDDDPGIRSLYEAWITQEYSVQTARDGQEALELLNLSVEVVVLDRDMPRTTGEEFIRACRLEGWDCRILMATASEPDGDILELGFDGYLTKPIDRETLLDHVSLLLRRQDHSEAVQDYYAVASKIALLEGRGLLNENKELYERLVERKRSLETEIEQLQSEFERRDFEAEFYQLTASGAAD